MLFCRPKIRLSRKNLQLISKLKNLTKNNAKPMP
jgi:hypothetical protein